MLYINYSMNPELYMNSASIYFNNVYEDEWFDDPFVKQMVKDIDKSEVISSRLIDSPVLGPIGPRDLSGGVKTLILMYKVDDIIFNGSSCGDNCSKWILKIADIKDLEINLGYIMNFGDKPFKVMFKNTGKVVTSMKELVKEIIEL